MPRLCLVAVLLAASAVPGLAEDTPPTVEVGPATAAPVETVTSAVTITLGTSGDIERKSTKYGCEGGDTSSLAVDYINAPPNYLALVPIDGTTLVFNTVLAASGAKYAAGKYVWWSKGTEASLYDLTQGEKAKPVLTCSEINETP
jgi:membrane-bound inhibitor of C-type lysozyme